MRTKIDKRIGPVPITLVAVFALAAFLSAGFWLVPNNGQTAEAQSATCKVDADDLADMLCSVSDDSVELVFENSTTSAVTLFAYASGGNRLELDDPASGTQPSVYGTERDVGTMFTGHRLSIAAAEDDPNSATDAPGTESITVSRSMANSDGMVFVLTASSAVIDVATPALNLTQVEVVAVVFEDGPDSEESSIVASMIGDSEVTDLGVDASQITIRVKDANGNPLIGWVDVAVEGGADVLFMGSGQKNIRVRPADAEGLGTMTSGSIMTTVSGLPKSGTVRVKVTATMGGVSLDGYIMRTGDPDTVTVSTYAPCDPGECEADDLILKKGEEFFVTAKATDSAGNNVTKIDNNFVMGAIAGATKADKAGLTPLDGEAATKLWWNSLGCKDMNTAAEDDPENAVMSEEASGKGEDSPFCVAFADLDDMPPPSNIYGEDQGVFDSVMDVVLRLVIPDYFAAFEAKETGVFNIEAEARGDKTDTVSVIVSGNASQIKVSCEPEIIPTDTGQTDCVVVVSDVNGNPSSNLDKTGDKITSTARVAVRSREVTLIGDDGNGGVALDKNGMGSFSILLREDAPEGINITVTVSAVVGTATFQDSIIVTYAEGGTTPTVPGGELGTVTDVITGFNRGGALQVSWTKAANASGYIIIAINVNDVNRDVVAVVLNDGDLDTQNISGLTPGATYDIYVAATASGGMNTLSDAARVTAK